MRWGETETCLFSKIYIGHACLWNPEHPYYKMRNKRLHAYREIMAQFYDATGIKLNEIEVKLKIKNLRSTYLQEIQKIKQRSNDEWTYRPAMKWFYEWYKCLSTIKKGDNELSLDVVVPSRDFSEVNDAVDMCEEAWASPSNMNGHSDPLPESEDYKLLILKPEPNDSSSEKRGSRSTYKIKKKKIKRQRESSTDDSDKTFGIFRSSLESSLESPKEDEFDIYGKYIASQLRKMDLQKALRVQIEIQSLVSEARISDLTDK